MALQDNLIGWLHRQAKLTPTELMEKFDRNQRDSLAKLVEHRVPSLSIPENLAPNEFAQWVHELRDSERDWNRSLGSVLLKASDESNAGDQQAATRLLRQFAQKCPWKPLKEIAEGEAQKHGE